jgi:hypothetical protein
MKGGIEGLNRHTLYLTLHCASTPAETKMRSSGGGRGSASNMNKTNHISHKHMHTTLLRELSHSLYGFKVVL